MTGQLRVTERATTVEADLSDFDIGFWNVTVFVEPALAVVSTLVIMAHDRLDRAPFSTGRTGCRFKTSFTNRGALLCEGDGAISVVRSGGAPGASFAGSALLVREDVVWSLQANVLERRVDRGDDLTLTHRVTLMSGGEVWWADERWFWQGSALVEALDNGEHMMTTTSPALAVPAVSRRFVDRTRALELGDGRVCHVGTDVCLSEPKLDSNRRVFFSPTRIWLERFRDQSAPLESISRPVDLTVARQGLELAADPSNRGVVTPWDPSAEGYLSQRHGSLELVERRDGDFEVWRLGAGREVAQLTAGLLVVKKVDGTYDLYRR